MLKKLVFLFFTFLIIGCSSEKSLESKQFDEYHMIQERLLNQNSFEKTDDFTITLNYIEYENQYRYDLIIDKPNITMYDITSMCYVDSESENMFPSIGIFDDDQFHLRKDYINKDEGYYKGIHLSGHTKKKLNAKVYISYYIDENTKKELFLEVNDET